MQREIRPVQPIQNQLSREAGHFLPSDQLPQRKKRRVNTGISQRLSGRKPEELTVMETERDGVRRYEFVWAAAGEQGDRLGRSVILDDGNYHYTLTILRDAGLAKNSQIIWNDVFRSFSLA